MLVTSVFFIPDCFQKLSKSGSLKLRLCGNVRCILSVSWQQINNIIMKLYQKVGHYFRFLFFEKTFPLRL